MINNETPAEPEEIFSENDLSNQMLHSSGHGNSSDKFCHDYSDMELKDDHENRPVWVMWMRSPQGQEADNRIILEAFSPEYINATDFLVAIAEPVSRPSHIHEYKLTKFSLYAAASVGLTDVDIIGVLHRFCKNKELPQEVTDFIQLHCSSYGKAKIVLRSNQYFIEAKDRVTMDRLLSFPCIIEGIKNALVER